MIPMEDFDRPWIKYYDPKMTRDTIDYPDISVYAVVKRISEFMPDKVAYEFQGKNTDYKTFMSKVDHAAACLYKMGVRKGDTFIICMPNCPQAVHIFYAVIKCGGIATMIHPLSAKNEIEEYLKISKAKYALTLDAFCNNFIAVKENTNLEKLIVASIKDELPFFASIGFSLTLGRKIPKHPSKDYIYEWKQFLAISDSDDMPEVENTGKDPSVILFSGGTTGTPKGIVLSNLNMNATAYGTLAVSECLPCHIDEVIEHGMMNYVHIRDYVVLSIMPMFHGFGLGIGIHTFFAAGAKCILIPSFTPDSFAKLIVKKRPNFIAGVPTLYEKMISSDIMKNADMSCLDGIFVGGDALTMETREKVDGYLKSHNAKTILREGYGLTESVTATCLTPSKYYRPGGIGIPFPDVLFKIVKLGTQETLPYGEEGEICISGPNIMLGYYGNPKETAEVLKVHADGRTWLHTGDVGTMDSDGFLYFKQRYKRMIIKSGYNIYPSQLENIINKYDGVKSSCVIGIPDPVKQQIVKVFIVLEDGYTPDEKFMAGLKAHCKDNIAAYAQPKEFEFIDSMPTTKVGKIAYRELEKMEEERRAQKKE